MRTIALETASQKRLRDCSEEVAGIYKRYI